MVEQPILSTLPDRMQYAAGVLAEATARELAENRFVESKWTPDSLNYRAVQWRREDYEKREAMIMELAKELAPTIWSPHEWEALSVENQRYCISKARNLVQSGWGKNDSD